MRFVAYSDIHNCAYTNGITLEDTITIEDQITQYALNNNIKHVLFLGDLYRNTNPLQVVIKATESAWKRRSDAGINTKVLVGNHDFSTKSGFSSHAFEAINIFTNDLKNFQVFDKISYINIEGINFLFLPSGHVITEQVIKLSSSLKPLVVLFHGLLIGSWLAGGVKATGGINPSDLIKLNAGLIVGGDNHTPQQLDEVLSVQSFYCGAPMMHTLGDIGQVRGWWDVTLENVNGNLQINKKLVPSFAPRFVKSSIIADNNDTAYGLILDKLSKELEGREGIIDIEISGKVTSSLSKEHFEEFIKSNFECRLVRVRYDMNFNNSIQISQTLLTYEEKWSNYILKSDIDGNEYNSKTLDTYGKQAIEMAKRQII